MISLIAAVAENGVIGLENKLPWKLSGDLKYFAATTTGKTVVMGKNTFLSIFNMIGKPLPNRRNIVLSHSMDKTDGVEIITDINTMKEIAKDQEVFVIGGTSVYAQALPLADRLYITEVTCSPLGDAFFPEYNKEDWNLISEDKHVKDEKNEYDYIFKIYERK